MKPLPPSPPCRRTQFSCLSCRSFFAAALPSSLELVDDELVADPPSSRRAQAFFMARARRLTGPSSPVMQAHAPIIAAETAGGASSAAPGLYSGESYRENVGGWGKGGTERNDQRESREQVVLRSPRAQELAGPEAVHTRPAGRRPG